MAARNPPVGFIESMECLPVAKLPEGSEWSYELKIDGYRLEAVKVGKKVTVFSRRRNVLNERFPQIAQALAKLPASTVIDGEVCALNDEGRSDFNLLQNFRSAEAQIRYFAFDILALKGKSLLKLPLDERRAILNDVLPANDHVRFSVVDRRPLANMMAFVKKNGLEGIVAKRIDSHYEPGKRSGLWSKHRISQGQEFVVGGFTPGNNGFDALIVGFYRGKELIYASRVRAGFIPATRREVSARFTGLQISKCPFANLPQKDAGRWGQGLTAEKMKECIWLTPEIVVRIDFLEWTGADHLRHTKFVALRDDKNPEKVVKEENWSPAAPPNPYR
jgi:DNA ligase D-like protein (predicted ligase)